jgi:hypothetical protein
MISRRSLLGGLGFLLLLALPWLLGWSFFAQEATYEHLRERYECLPYAPCAGDFDGDGQNGYVKIDRATQDDRWLVAIDSNRELLRIPYTSVDNSLRTHMALRDDTIPARLLIFDRSSQAYAMAGAVLAPVAPDVVDREILAALATQDERGGFDYRFMLRFAIIFGGAGYDLIVLCIAGGLFFIRRRLRQDE